MALNLPDELATVLNMLGYEWPQLDEDEIHRAADILRQFHRELGESLEQADRTMTDGVDGALVAATTGSYSQAWTEAKSANMSQLQEIVETAATGVDLFGHAVLGMKQKIIAELIITAAQLAAAVASATVTFGLGAAATPAIIFARKKVMDLIFDEVVAQIIGQVLSLVIEPLTDVAEAAATALLEAPVVSGAVAQTMQFHADLEAMEQVSSDMARHRDDQESIVDDLIARLSSLQISTAG